MCMFSSSRHGRAVCACSAALADLVCIVSSKHAWWYVSYCSGVQACCACSGRRPWCQGIVPALLRHVPGRREAQGVSVCRTCDMQPCTCWQACGAACCMLQQCNALYAATVSCCIAATTMCSCPPSWHAVEFKCRQAMWPAVTCRLSVQNVAHPCPSHLPS